MTRWRLLVITTSFGFARSSSKVALRRSSRAPGLAIAFTRQSRHRSAERYRSSAVSTDAIAGHAGIHHGALEADAVAAIAVDVIAVNRDLARNLLASLHFPVPVPVTPAIANAPAPDSVGPRSAAEGYTVLAVRVDPAA